MTDRELAEYIVAKARDLGRITDAQAAAALDRIADGTFVPANVPAFGLACARLATFLNQQTTAIPALIAQVQALATSGTAI